MIKTSSIVFGNLQKVLEILEKCCESFIWPLGLTFGETSEIFTKWSETFRKCKNTIIIIYRFDLWEFYLIRKLYGHWQIWNFSSHVKNSFSTFKEKSLCSHACNIFHHICELILTMLLHRLVLLETLAGHQGISGLSVSTGHWTHIHV